MSTVIPLALLVAASAAVVTALYAVVVRAGGLQPATVDPFHGSGTPDPSADTLANGSSLVRTSAPPPSDWRVATLTNLGQVEDLLDALENHGVSDREVTALGNNCFAVRWR